MAYVDNLALGLRLAADKAAAGSAYWIADETPYTMNEIVDTVEDLLETEFRTPCARTRMRLPDAASGIAYAADMIIQGAGFYNSKVHVLSEMNKTIACRIARARAELGYQPPVALREGMRRSLRWCFDVGQLRIDVSPRGRVDGIGDAVDLAVADLIEDRLARWHVRRRGVRRILRIRSRAVPRWRRC